MRVTERREEFISLVTLMLVLIWAAWDASSFPARARVFPQLIAIGAAILGAVEMARLVIARRRGGPEIDAGAGVAERRGRTWAAQAGAGAPYLLWIAGYYAGIGLLGFVPASFLFVSLFLARVAQVRWSMALVASAVLLAVLMAFGQAMSLAWPLGLIAEWLDLRL